MWKSIGNTLPRHPWGRSRGRTQDSRGFRWHPLASYCSAISIGLQWVSLSVQPDTFGRSAQDATLGSNIQGGAAAAVELGRCKVSVFAFIPPKKIEAWPLNRPVFPILCRIRELPCPCCHPVRFRWSMQAWLGSLVSGDLQGPCRKLGQRWTQQYSNPHWNHKLSLFPLPFPKLESSVQGAKHIKQFVVSWWWWRYQPSRAWQASMQLQRTLRVALWAQRTRRHKPGQRQRSRRRATAFSKKAL